MMRYVYYRRLSALTARIINIMYNITLVLGRGNVEEYYIGIPTTWSRGPLSVV